MGPRGPAGTPLAQQVPQLVELHLEGPEPRLLLGGRRLALAVGPLERVLLVDELVDVPDDLAVLSHPATLTAGARMATWPCRACSTSAARMRSRSSRTTARATPSASTTSPRA